MQTVLTAFYHLLCHSNTSLQHKNRHLQCQDTSLYKKVTTSSFDAATYKKPKSSRVCKNDLTGTCRAYLSIPAALVSSERNPCEPPGYLVTSATTISRKYHLSEDDLPIDSLSSHSIGYALFKCIGSFL